VLMSVALVGVALMVCMQVLFRFVLGAPLHYTEEVARYLTIWAALLGASLGVRSGTHFSVRYVVNRLPRPAARAVGVFARLLVAAFLVAFVATSALLLETALVQSSPAARIPMVLVYAAAPVAGVLMLFFILTELIGDEVRRLPSEVFEDDLP
jgi:TRAP-type C4-dicarboxylate transport system permease small subunit